MHLNWGHLKILVMLLVESCSPNAKKLAHECLFSYFYSIESYFSNIEESAFRSTTHFNSVISSKYTFLVISMIPEDSVSSNLLYFSNNHNV